MKYKPDETTESYKAHLVAKNFSQKYEIDYLETFAPGAKMNIAIIILAIVVIRNWRLDQLDIKNVFINGDLDE